MEKNITSWLAILGLWMFVFIPFINKQADIGTYISTALMGGLTIYGFKYKE